MKLVVDTHHLMLENAGTKRVTVNLLAELKMTPGIEVTELQPGYSIDKGKSVASKLKGHLMRFIWVHLHLPIKCRLIKADFLISPEFNTPMFRPCPRAVIAHDAHMRAQREYTSALWFYFYYIPFIELAIRRSDLIFTVSEFAKKQVVSLMKVNSAKVFVAYNGVDELFLREKKPAALPNGLSKDLYILFIGTFEARKNVERLIEAFGALKKKHPKQTNKLRLAIVGQPATGIHSDRSQQISVLIKKLELESDVVMCGYVPDDLLPFVYQDAAFIVFPSLQEGFGLPIVEAFASETAIITSNVCSMPEIAGEAALLVDPYNVGDILEKMELLYFDIALRQRLIAAGKLRLKEFTWRKCADKMLSKILPLVNKTATK
ncbi:MAG: glycosyltransferase family 4 protein [Imperialibacter sp.]|uniref:glycosyltransferase family 4 protein n=1 Tax=Imperialibacter sp. TaxID=2038411 RepID=UPI0030DAFE35|tara:strand:- start:8393 stop:9520 length:1128 start_codon:yes stop_codon:yes gene_type:complete